MFVNKMFVVCTKLLGSVLGVGVGFLKNVLMELQFTLKCSRGRKK